MRGTGDFMVKGVNRGFECLVPFITTLFTADIISGLVDLVKLQDPATSLSARTT